MKNNYKSLAIIISMSCCAVSALLQDVNQVSFGEVPIDSCFENGCHDGLENKFDRIRTEFAGGVHADLEIDGKKITCYDCHMIPQEHLDGEIEGSPPSPWEQPALCGRCHSNAVIMHRFNPAADLAAEQLFWTSEHGKAQRRIKNVVERQPRRLSTADGIELANKVAGCTSCHGVHGISPVDDTKAPVFPLNVSDTCGRCHGNEQLIRSYFNKLAEIEPPSKPVGNKIELLTEVIRDYESEVNVHREALVEKGMLDAPTCNDCHGNHGASPPGAGGSTRVARICGSCHSQSYDDYMHSPKSELFDDSEYRDCFACHTNHRIVRTSDEMVGLHESSICNRCHGNEDEGLSGRETILDIKDEIDKLKTARESAESVISEAERKGMDVSAGREELAKLNTALVSARAKIHRFDIDPVRQAAEPGYANAEEAEKIGRSALEHLAFRHWGLGASSLIILVFALLLFLKIRQVDRKNDKP